MSYKKGLQGGFLLAVGGGVGAASTFARNIIIARIISVEDFGIAATFGITMGLVEMSSSLGLDRLIVQAKDGNKPRLQATVQAFNVFRGALLGLILFVIAEPIALLFNLPDVIWAFQCLAVLPVIRGFIHMDLARLQRQKKFLPSVATENVPLLLTLALSAPLALYFNDYRVMLWLLLLQTICGVVASHALSSRSYRWAFDKELLLRMFVFGWPLLINGFLMFAIFYADRAVVGALLGMDELGWFSAAFSLTLAPTLLITRVIQVFILPTLSGSRGNPVEHEKFVLLCYQVCLICGVIVAIGFSIAGPAFILVFYGEKFSAAIAIIGLLGITQGVRLAKAAPSVIAIAHGKTRIPLYANIVRAIGIVFAIIAIWQGYGVLGLIIGGLIGEVLSLTFSYYLTSKLTAGSNLPLMTASVACALVISTTAYFTYGTIVGVNPIPEIVFGTIASLVGVMICMIAMPTFYKLLRDIIASLISQRI